MTSTSPWPDNVHLTRWGRRIQDWEIRGTVWLTASRSEPLSARPRSNWSSQGLLLRLYTVLYLVANQIPPLFFSLITLSRALYLEVYKATGPGRLVKLWELDLYHLHANISFCWVTSHGKKKNILCSIMTTLLESSIDPSVMVSTSFLPKYQEIMDFHNVSTYCFEYFV